MKMIKKHRKLIINIFILILIIVFVSTYSLSGANYEIHYDNQSIHILLDSKNVKDIYYNEIDSLTLVKSPDFGDPVPNSSLSSGRSHNNYYGIWKNKEWGEYSLFVQSNINNCIVIKSKNDYTVINLESDDVTEQLYSWLSSMSVLKI